MNTFQELTKHDLVIKRAQALKKARAFFDARGYFEVDCPILSPYAAIDNHIDLFSTESSPRYFLHSSPEYGMKKLLSSKAPSIYQLSHVFRAFEKGSKHKEEFMMAEFYKLGAVYEDFIEETLDFIELFTGPKKRVYMSYREVFETYLQIDPFKDHAKLCLLLESQLGLHTKGWETDDLLTTAMGALVEPKFDPDSLVVLSNFPASQAALSETFLSDRDELLAKRFEIYHRGLELCNGYKELKDPRELRSRFEDLNKIRLLQSKDTYPIDTQLLEAMGTYFPDCCGVACGFDRLFMLELGAREISSISYSY